MGLYRDLWFISDIYHNQALLFIFEQQSYQNFQLKLISLCLSAAIVFSLLLADRKWVQLQLIVISCPIRQITEHANLVSFTIPLWLPSSIIHSYLYLNFHGRSLKFSSKLYRTDLFLTACTLPRIKIKDVLMPKMCLGMFSA